MKSREQNYPSEPATHAAKIERLREALENFTPGESDFFDSHKEEDKAKVRNRALLLLDQRGRSREELRKRLAALEFDPITIDEVLDDLRDCGLLDDQAFATEWVRQRHARRGKSRKALSLELKEKGVGVAQRAEALKQISDDDEFEMARQLAEKKARSIKAMPANGAEYDKILRRVVGMLARRGFGSGLSIRVSKEAIDARLEAISA